MKKSKSTFTVSPSFVGFAAQCGVKLTPGQRVLCAVAFDGVEPRDLKGADRDLARLIFGSIDTLPPEARHVVVAVCGARAGKSRLLCALRLLHLALIVDLSTLAPGEVASGIIVAPDLRLARQTLRFALGAARSVPAIASLIFGETSDSFSIAREGGRSVVIECLPATRGGSALRGRSLVGAALDEGAFFRDESSVVNDVEVFKAVAPRVMPGGQIIIATTAWAEAGLAYELFTFNNGTPTTATAARAPTTLLRPDARTKSIVDRERQRDPENARREFDAEFMLAGTSFFFDSQAVDAAIGELPSGAPSAKAGAIDLAFVSDSSTNVIVGRFGEVHAVIDLLELKPAKGKPLVTREVMEAFVARAKDHGLKRLAADSHYVRTAVEYAAEHNIGIDEVPGSMKTEIYLAVREAINAKRLILPNEPRLIAQLKAIVSRPTPGGALQISSPRRAGAGHGDLVSALVLAVHAAMNGRSGPMLLSSQLRAQRGIGGACGDGYAPPFPWLQDARGHGPNDHPTSRYRDSGRGF